MSRGVGVDGKSLVHMAAHTMYLLVHAEQPHTALPGFRLPFCKIYLDSPLEILESIHLKCLRHGQCPGQWGLKRPLGCSVGLSPRS